MSKEIKPKRTRSTKKVSEESPHTAELEAKIADLEAKLANLSSQVQPTETRPAAKPSEPQAQRGTLPAGMKPAEAPKPAPAPRPRPAASGPTHGTLPAGMKPAAAPPAQEEESRPSYAAPEPGEVAPAYAQLSSSGYTGNKYYATRARLSYHPPNKQFKGQVSATTGYAEPPAPQPAPEPKPQRGTLPAGMKPAEQEKKSMWKAKGSEYENYVPEEETHKAPPPPPAPEPKAQRGTLPAGFKPTTPPPSPKEEPKPAPEPAKPRPAASGPTHGTLPAGMKPTPPPAPKEEARGEGRPAPEPSEVAPAYAQLSSSGYTGNRYFATRRRLSYHPPNKQFTGSASSGTTEAPPAPAPAPKKSRGTLPAGFKP
ncbi:MAG TPA: hypothetical protein VJ792_00785 [Candidatus Nitrosotalea sp.]|nr:hypothetical protein [Candidatus Nitrosotalea sp.]